MGFTSVAELSILVLGTWLVKMVCEARTLAIMFRIPWDNQQRKWQQISHDHAAEVGYFENQAGK